MTHNGDQQPPSRDFLSQDSSSYPTSVDQDMGGGIDELMDQASFWDKLRSFGTDEKDDLIEKFRSYTQTTLSDNGIKFFLEMVNWNLQAAIGAFYDFEQPRNDVEPGFQLVSDITVGDGEAVTPDTRFVKRWRIKNVGTSEWSEGTVIKHLQGDIMPVTPIVNIGRLEPGCSTEVSVSMVSPNCPGTFRSVWRAHDVSGLPFGDPIWVIVTVDDCGILGITQQLNDCHAVGSSDDSLLGYKRRTDQVFDQLNHELKVCEADHVPQTDETDDLLFDQASMPIHHFLQRRSGDSSKWTEYSLKDVDELDGSGNRSAALEFLQSLKNRRKNEETTCDHKRSATGDSTEIIRNVDRLRKRKKKEIVLSHLMDELDGAETG